MGSRDRIYSPKALKEIIAAAGGLPGRGPLETRTKPELKHELAESLEFAGNRLISAYAERLYHGPRRGKHEPPRGRGRPAVPEIQAFIDELLMIFSYVFHLPFSTEADREEPYEPKGPVIDALDRAISEIRNGITAGEIGVGDEATSAALAVELGEARPGLKQLRLTREALRKRVLRSDNREILKQFAALEDALMRPTKR